MLGTVGTRLVFGWGIDPGSGRGVAETSEIKLLGSCLCGTK